MGLSIPGVRILEIPAKRMVSLNTQSASVSAAFEAEVLVFCSELFSGDS